MPGRRLIAAPLVLACGMYSCAGSAHAPENQPRAAAPPPVAPPAPSARAQLDAALADLTCAVLAADKPAYLAHIDHSDPIFLAEQTHWAEDLEKHKPLEFTAVIADDPETTDDDPVITDSRAEVTLRIHYRMDTGHAAVPSGKTAQWPALFTREDPDGDGPLPPTGPWLYRGERWQSISGTCEDGTPFDVLFLPLAHMPAAARGRYPPPADPRAVAEQVRAAFPPAKAHADEGFEVTIHRHLQIKLYNNMEHLKAGVYLSMPDEVLGGWNEPGESIKFMATYAASTDRWTAAFAHEYGHVATWEMGPQPKNMPWWVAEGVAELSAEYFTHDRDRIDRMLRRMAASPGFGQPGGPVEWADIADYDAARPEVKHLAYFQGHHMVGYISERWGRKGRNAWLRAMTSGKSLDDATREALGLPFADLDKQWRESLLTAPDATIAAPPK